MQDDTDPECVTEEGGAAISGTITVKIPFLPWTGRDSLKIAVPANTPKIWRLRAAVEIAHRNGASLAGASLIGARLDGARLEGARLEGASLDGASLVGASLDEARLVGASLVGARLDEARLDHIRNDLWDVLLRAQPEVSGLLAALRDGRINGSTYEGECACLAGTIANIRHVPYGDLGFANASRPIERWVLGIKKGDRPNTSQIARITESWIVEFQQLTNVSAIPAEA